MYNNYLIHHGVKGMKWGVRKDPKPGSRRYYKQQYKSERKAALDRMKKTGQRLTSSGKQNDMKSVKKMTDQYDKDLRTAKQNYQNSIIRNKYKTKNKKYDQKIGKIMSKREINRQRISDKYDKKILKAKNKNQTEIAETYKAKKAYKLKDFDGGTKMINKGINHYKSVNSTYANMKIKALNDSSIKKTKAYKTAGRKYAIQLFSDANYGKAYTTLNYASSYGRGYKPQKNSISWKK